MPIEEYTPTELKFMKLMKDNGYSVDETWKELKASRRTQELTTPKSSLFGSSVKTPANLEEPQQYAMDKIKTEYQKPGISPQAKGVLDAASGAIMETGRARDSMAQDPNKSVNEMTGMEMAVQGMPQDVINLAEWIEKKGRIIPESQEELDAMPKKDKAVWERFQKAVQSGVPATTENYQKAEANYLEEKIRGGFASPLVGAAKGTFLDIPAAVIGMIPGEAADKVSGAISGVSEDIENQPGYNQTLGTIGEYASYINPAKWAAKGAVKAGEKVLPGIFKEAAKEAPFITKAATTTARGTASSIGATTGVALSQGRLPGAGETGVGLVIDGLLGSLGPAWRPLKSWYDKNKAIKGALTDTASQTAEGIPSILTKNIEPVKVTQKDVSGENLVESGLDRPTIESLEIMRNETDNETYNLIQDYYAQSVKAADSSPLRKVYPGKDGEIKSAIYKPAGEIADVYKAVSKKASDTAAAIKAEAKTLKEKPQIAVGGIRNEVANQLDDLGIKVTKNGQLDFTDSRLSGGSFSNEQSLLSDIWDFTSNRKGEGGTLRGADDLLIKIQNVFDRAKKDEMYSTIYGPIKAFRDAGKNALEEMADSQYKTLAKEAVQTIELKGEIERWFKDGAKAAPQVLRRLLSDAVTSSDIENLVKSLETWSKSNGLDSGNRLYEKSILALTTDQLAGVKSPMGSESTIAKGIKTGLQVATGGPMGAVNAALDIITPKTPEQRAAIESFLEVRSNPEIKNSLLKPLANDLDAVIEKTPALSSVPGLAVTLRSVLLGQYFDE